MFGKARRDRLTGGYFLVERVLEPVVGDLCCCPWCQLGTGLGSLSLLSFTKTFIQQLGKIFQLKMQLKELYSHRCFHSNRTAFEAGMKALQCLCWCCSGLPRAGAGLCPQSPGPALVPGLQSLSPCPSVCRWPQLCWGTNQ